MLPQAWFCNTWAFEHHRPRPQLRSTELGSVHLAHPELGEYQLYCDQAPALLFCDNDTNGVRLYNRPHAGQFYKDGINDYLVEGKQEAINAAQHGTKVAAHYQLTVAAGQAQTVRVRLSKTPHPAPFTDFDQVVALRRQEADSFYASLQEGMADPDARSVQRQALAGLLWSKQFYYYDLNQWLDGDPNFVAPPSERRQGRNSEWRHLYNADIISMPDKWEYPWYAAWDLAFHCIPLAMVDAEFAKQQLRLLTRDWYMHPNGQLPAYEWNLADANPPVHAWATWRVYQMDQKQRGHGDTQFLEAMFHKLSLNFSWWVNRKDRNGRNIFEGGFLGLDNIGVFDRSAPLPTGGHIEQSDGTSWMAMYALNLMRIALELALTNPVYQEMASKFFDHFLYIVEAMTKGGDGQFNLWDEEDSFYYDVLHTPDGVRTTLKVRSIVGLIPLFAVEVLDDTLLRALPEFAQRLRWLLHHRPHLADLVSQWQVPGQGERHRLSLLRSHRLQCLLTRMLDEQEFLSEFGIRALSRYHREQPYHFPTAEVDFTVAYLPGESDSDMFGGNSNWRGPIWFPINYLLIESLQRFYAYYGDAFRVEYPTGSGQRCTLQEIAVALTARLSKLFLRDAAGRRPAFGDNERLQHDPHFRDYPLFYEYFHGDDGRGLGASHQTGWTGLLACLLASQHRTPLPAEQDAAADAVV